MAKSFTVHEREIIRKKLIQSCEECWSRYGYKKTSVGEICSMSGISTGAFYLFYSSKELLFVDTAKTVSEHFAAMMIGQMPPNPTKYDFAKILKHAAAELKKRFWLLTLHDELEILARKLPAGFFDETQIKTIEDYAPYIKKFGLKPTVPIEDAIATVQILMRILLYNNEIIIDRFNTSFEFIVDSTIEKLFE